MDYLLICAICLYVPPRPGLDADDLASTQVLTVKSGLLVCTRHAGVAPDIGMVLHYALNDAARMESHGDATSPVEYHTWRRGAEDAGA